MSSLAQEEEITSHDQQSIEYYPKNTGQLVLQKTFNVKEKGRSVKNTGENDMYIVENAHEAIISQEIFNKVQEIKKQGNLKKE